MSGFLIVDFGVVGEDEAAVDAVAVDAACFGFAFAFGVDGSAALAFCDHVSTFTTPRFDRSLTWLPFGGILIAFLVG